MFPLAAVSIAAHTGGPWAAGFGWFFLVIPVLWIAFFALLFTALRRARWAGRGPDGGWAHAGRGAESTLSERFAQGDIDEVEYRARLEVLRANAVPRKPGKA